MNNKKYLSLEEAAKLLGVSTIELTRLREEGQVRGFADRGTWKFRQEDVEKTKRIRQSDSSPDVPLVTEDENEEFGSSVVLGGEEEDELGAQPTIIRGSALDDEDLDAGTSDSDVRLILDDSLVNSGDSKLDVSLSVDSDSDVRLTEDNKKSGSTDQSDSDVKLVTQDSDSDVRLADVDDSGPKSDSDVKIYEGNEAQSGPGDSSLSDVKIMNQDQTAGGESDLLYAGSESGVLEDNDESGSTSVFADDSGIALEGASDSGISLAADDEDSGISLLADDDEGITLAEDSGISISPSSRDSAETMNLEADSASDVEATSFDVPSSTGDSEFDLDAADSSHDTSVILFDDDEDDFATTKPQRSGSDEAVAAVVEEDADLEVDGDVFDVDEADDLDVFDAGDEAFEDSFQTGASHAEFSTGSAVGRGAVAAPEAEWTKGDFAGVLLATTMTVVCAIVSFDLVRSMWHWEEPSVVAGPILEALAGLF